MKRIQGSISVFLALTITLMLSFCLILIESARENTMLLKAEIVFDTGINSLLAEYHSVLWDKYDLLYVDCSYGQDMPDYEQTKGHLQAYIEKNLQYDGGSWLNLNYESCELGNVLLATDFSGADFYKQAIADAEASVGLSYIEKVLEWFAQMEGTYPLRVTMDEGKEAASNAIEEANGTEVEVKPAVWGKDKEGNPVIIEEAEYETVDIKNPLDDIWSANILLRQVVENYSDISSSKIDLSALASYRSLAAGNSDEDKEVDGLLKKALFCKYLFDHFTSYTDFVEDGQNGLHCQLEYILGGKNSDSMNLEVVAAELLAIREIDNYLSLLQDEVRKAEAHALAIAAAGIAPWLKPVVYQAMMLYWAYEESVADLQILFRGGEIPLVKSLPIESISEFTLDYEEYLLLLVMLQNREVLVMRAIDLVELTVREEQPAFCMDACISQAILVGNFTDNYDKRYTITKKLRYY